MIDVRRQRISPRLGRPTRFSLTNAERGLLRRLTLEKESMALAIEFLAESPTCSAATRREIMAVLDRAAQRRRPPAWPVSILRAARVTEEERAMFRGPKTHGEAEMVVRRDMTVVLEDGQRVALGPYGIYETDDMSGNEPFRYYDETLGQWRTGRQILCTLDVYSAAWLGNSPLGRQKDAYRIEDQMDHLWDIVCDHGLPHVAWRFERGPWENSAIDGIKLNYARPTGVTRWGGLDALFAVVHAFKSRSKGLIEGSFDLLQSLLGHASESIGRRRGEFERGTKLQRRANKGDSTALENFWDIGTAADAYAEAMRLANGRPKRRRAFGRDMVTPDDLIVGATRRECPAGEAWRFLPVKRELAVRKGMIECMVDHYPLPFRFRVNGVENSLHLGTGDRVLVAFHPGRPEDGCHVFHHEVGARNRLERPWGELLTVAPLAEDAPQICLSRQDQEHRARKAANAAVRSSFRSIMGAGERGTRKETARDGFGNRSEVVTAATPRPTREVSAPPARRPEPDNSTLFGGLLKRRDRLAKPAQQNHDQATHTRAASH